MINLIFVDPTGQEHRVEAVPGQSVMQAAASSLVPGIEASCGGSCVCATCHCYIDESAVSQVPAPDELEKSMLECLLEYRANSRLTCQIVATESLDGVRFQVAASQH
jgi:2Fe-2S ferredoxin